MYRIDTLATRKPIPCFLGFYIDRLGNITDDDNQVVTIDDFNAQTNVDVRDPMVLALIAYQNFKWPFGYWKHLVVRKPENSDNIEDMVLGIERPVEDLSNPGFYLIPYFSRYVINKRSKILNLYTRTFVQSSKTDNGYWSARLKSDDDKTGNRLTHRITALAFLPYPFNFQMLEVNHLNGDTLDDNYNNLEWATRVSNLEHSKMNDLFRKRNPHKKKLDKTAITIRRNLLETCNEEIKIKDVTNDNIFIFNNLVHAASQLGIGIRAIRYALNSGDGRVIKGYQVKYQNDWSAWPEPNYTRARNYEVTLPDGERIICSAEEAARYCGVTRSSLQRLIREGRNKGSTDALVRRIGTGNVLV